MTYKLLLLVFVALIAEVISDQAKVCSSGWTMRDDYCYKLFTESLTYSKASQYCRNQGGFLSSIVTWSANSWINSFIPGNCAEFWIGGGRSNSNSPFKWDDSRKFAYSNFDGGHPKYNNNYISYIHNPMFGTVGKWRSLTNDYKKPFLCGKMPSSPTVTNPPTTTKQPTTPAPAVTTTLTPVTTTPNCWTCPSGYIHWFDPNSGITYTPADKCMCVPMKSTTPAPTTPAPTTSSPKYNCWTCPAGYSHWFDLGLPQPSDICACVMSGTTSNSGSSATKSTAQYLSQLISVMTPSSSSTGSISFASDVTPYAPWSSAPLSLVNQLLKNLVTQTKYQNIMVYYTDNTIAQAAEQVGLTVLGIIGLTTDPSANAASIQRVITAAKTFPKTVIAVACGNEMGSNYGTTNQVAMIINQCISAVRAAGVVQPVGVIDIYNSWYQNGAGWYSVANNADFLGCNEYPWYANQFSPVPFICATPSTAASVTMRAIQTVKKLYPSKNVILTEFGWPGADNGNILGSANIFNGQVCADANNYNQKVAVQSTIDLFRSYNLPCNTFSAYRESWKSIGTSAIESQWGVCSGTSPYNCYNAPN